MKLKTKEVEDHQILVNVLYPYDFFNNLHMVWWIASAEQELQILLKQTAIRQIPWYS